MLQRLDPVHPRQLDIHKDEGGRRHLGQSDPLLRVVGLDRPVAVELEDVALQLAVLFVVLDDEDQFARHQHRGNVKVKVDPRPGSLSTQIRPPCNSTNFFARVRPRPVPSCLRVSSLPTWRNSSKMAGWSSGAMPIPVSMTAISTAPSVRLAFRLIRPPSGVNLTALDRRFSRICLTLRSSPTTSPSRESMSTCRAMPWRPARSLTRVTAFSRAVGRWNGAGASSMRPASILDRSRMSLISDRRCWPEAYMSLRYSSCLSLRAPNMRWSSTSEKPITAFSGVRSSWDMLARNSDLWRLAASSCRLLSAISWKSWAF